MKEFDELKDMWKSQKDEASISIENIRERAENKLHSQQRQLIFVNLGLTVTFIVVLAVLTWIYTSFPERSLFFKLSLISMGLLLMVYLAGMWSGILYRDLDPTQKPERYIEYARRKIRIRLFLLQNGAPVYILLLLSAMGFYMTDVLAGVESWIVISIAIGIVGYVAGIWFIFKNKRQAQIKKNKNILSDLREWRNSL